MTSNDIGWHQMTSDDIIWHQMTPNDIRWHHMTNDYNRWYRVYKALNLSKSYWNIGQLKYLDSGSWYIGILKHWNIEIFEYWDNVILRGYNIKLM